MTVITTLPAFEPTYPIYTDFEQFIAGIRKIDPDFKSAIEHAKKVPFKEIQEEVAPHLSIQSHFLFRFFFNIFDTFATAMNFYDQVDPPASIYEKQVLIMIYYRFFQIPFALGLILQPLVVVAWQAYVITMAILVVTAALICIYIKWFRPFPLVIPGCEINRDLIEKEYRKPINGLDLEMNSLISRLNSDRPIMVLGATGIGKTTLIHKLQQKINRGEVPASLKDKKIVTIHGGTLMAKSQLGIGDRLKQIKSALSGFEEQTIIHIDELQAIATSANAFELIKEFIRTSKVQFITTTTLEAFEKVIIPLDIDQSFRRSYGANYIEVEKWKPVQVEALLEEMASSLKDVVFADGAIEKIVELTDKNLQSLPQPAKAIELFGRVVEQFRARFKPRESEELLEKRGKLHKLEARYRNTWPQGNHAEIETLKLEIEGLEKASGADIQRQNEYHEWIEEKERLKKQLILDAIQLKEGKKTDEATQKRYLTTYFYELPDLMKKVNEYALSPTIVEKVFEDYKQTKESIHQVKRSHLKVLGLIQEVKEASKEIADCPHGMGKPTFTDILQVRWKKNEAQLLSLGFEDYAMYEAAVCDACNL